jgi:prephenate dehydrogenase
LVSFDRFGIVGYGHFGQFMARSLAAQGSVLVTDTDRTKLPPGGDEIRAAEIGEVAQCDLVLVAVPAASLERALEGLRPLLSEQSVVMDVVSTKVMATESLTTILSDHPNLLATHPLFGPPSMKKMRKAQRLVVTHCRGERAQVALRFLRKKYGLNIHEMSPEDHDRSMAYMQALPFFIARALVDLGFSELDHREVLSLPSFEKLAAIAAIEEHHTDGMFDTSQRSNPFAADARRHFIEVLEKLNAEIDAGHISFQPSDR